MARAAARTSRRSKAKTSVRLDMRGIEGRVTVPEDEYLVVVDEVEEKEGDKAPYFSWKFKIAEGEYEGNTLYNNTSLSEQALWNLKTLLEALGVEIPDEPFDLDLEEMKGLELMVSVEHETYEGKKRPKIVDFWPAEDKPKGRGRADKDKDDRPSRRNRDKDKDKDKDEVPARRGRGKDDDKSARGKASSKKDETLTQDEINEMSQDELEDAIKDFDLDVDLSKFRTLRKMQAAVIDAAEVAKVLEE